MIRRWERYLQADPLGLVDGASVYGYALQNPGRYTDPREERVAVVYRPLNMRGGWIAERLSGGVAKHCATFVIQDENDCFCSDEIDPDGIIAQFSLLGPNPRGDQRSCAEARDEGLRPP